MFDQEKEPYTFKENSEKELEKFVGIENYATSGFSGIGGEYKTNFKDFIVKEVIDNGKILDIYEDSNNSVFSEELNDRYTTFNLTKVNMDTFKAVDKISKALKIPKRLITYSGLKDKQSISVQKISIKGNFVEQLRKTKLFDIFIRNINTSKKPVKLGSHLGNNFTVTIRNIKNSTNLEHNSQKILKFLNEYGFPNYFGLQRFGTIRPNSHIIGYYLLNNDYEKAFQEFVLRTYSTEKDDSRNFRVFLKKEENFKEALDNFPQGLHYERKLVDYLHKKPRDYHGAIHSLSPDLRRLLISSFQSYIFNKMLSLRIKKGFPLFKPISGDVISILDDFNGNITSVKYVYGGLYDKYLEEALKLNRASIVIPIIGKLTNLDEFPLMSSIFREFMKEENINLNFLESEYMGETEFKGSIRAMTVKPLNLDMIEFTDDEVYQERKKMVVNFSLRKGSYATMLIREIIK